MRTIEKTIYQFSELSEAAKEKAREWYRRAGDGDTCFSELVIEDAATIAELFGLDIRQELLKSGNYAPSVLWRGFYSQGDGAAFAGKYSYKKGALKAVKEYAPIDTELHRIVKSLQKAQSTVFYRAECTTKASGFYSTCTAVDCSYVSDQYRALPVAVESAIVQAMRDFAAWIYRQLEAEYDYQNADEQIDEMIEANEYEFDDTGARA